MTPSSTSPPVSSHNTVLVYLNLLPNNRGLAYVYATHFITQLDESVTLAYRLSGSSRTMWRETELKSSPMVFWWSVPHSEVTLPNLATWAGSTFACAANYVPLVSLWQPSHPLLLFSFCYRSSFFSANTTDRKQCWFFQGHLSSVFRSAPLIYAVVRAAALTHVF